MLLTISSYDNISSNFSIVLHLFSYVKISDKDFVSLKFSKILEISNMKFFIFFIVSGTISK